LISSISGSIRPRSRVLLVKNEIKPGQLQPGARAKVLCHGDARRLQTGLGVMVDARAPLHAGPEAVGRDWMRQ
jgi:hypothetical protein